MVTNTWTGCNLIATVTLSKFERRLNKKIDRLFSVDWKFSQKPSLFFTSNGRETAFGDGCEVFGE